VSFCTKDHYDSDRLSLYCTCRQLFAETAQKYFDSKLLPIATAPILLLNGSSNRHLATKLTPAQKGMITQVAIRAFAMTDVEYPICSLLGELTNLKKVMITAYNNSLYKVMDPGLVQIKQALRHRDVKGERAKYTYREIWLDYGSRQGVRDLLKWTHPQVEKVGE
jgi:hypothetical protein